MQKNSQYLLHSRGRDAILKFGIQKIINQCFKCFTNENSFQKQWFVCVCVFSRSVVCVCVCVFCFTGFMVEMILIMDTKGMVWMKGVWWLFCNSHYYMSLFLLQTQISTWFIFMLILFDVDKFGLISPMKAEIFIPYYIQLYPLILLKSNSGNWQFFA